MATINTFYQLPMGVVAGPMVFGGTADLQGGDFFLPPFAPVCRLFGGKGDEGCTPCWPYGRICHRTDGGTPISESVEGFLAGIVTLQRFLRSRSAVIRGTEDTAAWNIVEKLGGSDKKLYVKALSTAFSHHRIATYLQPVLDAVLEITDWKIIITVEERLITEVELKAPPGPALLAANGRLARAMPPYLMGTDIERMIHADIEAYTENGVPEAKLKEFRETSRTIVYAAMLEEMAKVLETLAVPEGKLRTVAGDILNELRLQIKIVRNVVTEYAMMYVWRTALKLYSGTLTAEQGRAFIKGYFRIGDTAVEEIFADVPKELTDVMASFLAPQLHRWPTVSEFKRYFSRTAKVARHGLAEYRLAAEAVRIKETAATREAFIVKMLHFMEFERTSRHSNMARIKMIAWRQALNLADLEKFSWSELKGFFENGYDVADIDDAFSGLPHDIQPADADILKLGIIRRVLANADASRNFNRAHTFIGRQVARFAGVMEREDEILALFPEWVKLTHERMLNAIAVHFASHMEVDFVGRLLTAAVRQEVGEEELLRGFSPQAAETMKRAGIDDYFAYFYKHMRDLPMPLIEAGLDYLAGTVDGGSLNNRTEMHRRRAEIYKQILARVEERFSEADISDELKEGLHDEAVNVLAKLTSGGKEIFFKKVEALIDNWLLQRLVLADKTIEWIMTEEWGHVEDRFGSDSVIEAQTALIARLPAAFRSADIVRRIVAESVAHGASGDGISSEVRKMKFLSRLDFYAGILRELDARLGGNGTAELAAGIVEYAKEQIRDGEAHRGAPSRKLVERFISITRHPPATTASAGRRENGDPVGSWDSRPSHAAGQSFRGNDRASGNDKAPRRHRSSPDPLLASPEPDGVSPFEGTSARIAAAEGRWTGEGRPFGIDGADAAGDKGSIVAIFDGFLGEALAAKGSDVAVTAVPHDGFELRYDRKNNKVAVRLSPSISFDTALGTFRRFMRSFSRFSRENPFVPAVAVELGDGQPFEYSLTAMALSTRAIDFAKGGHPTAAVFAARWAYALESDLPDVLNVLSYALLEQVRMFKIQADIDAIIQNLAEATQLAVRWRKIDSENEFVQKRFKDISYRYRRVVKWLWGERGTPPHENIPLIISILEKVREIDVHPDTGYRLRNLYTAYGQTRADLGRHSEAEPYLKKALKLDPANIRVVTSLAMAVRWQGRPQEALDIVTAFMNGHKDTQIDQKLKLELARAYSELENFTEAEDILTRLLQEEIGDRTFYYNASLQLAYVKQRLKKYSEVLDIYSRLPDSPRKAYKLGHLFRLMARSILQGDPERLIMLEKALERSRYAYSNTPRTDPHFFDRRKLLADILKFAEIECRTAGLEEKALKYANERNRVAL